MAIIVVHAVGTIELHRRPVVELRRRAYHCVHHEPQGPARPRAVAPGAYGRAHQHVLLHQRRVQDPSLQLPWGARQRPQPLRRDRRPHRRDRGLPRGGGGGAHEERRR